MQRNIFAYILRYSFRQQLVILALTLSALPFYYASLDLPKRIINQVIDAEPDKFPEALRILGWTIGAFGQMEWLLLLCSVFLVLVLTNGAFKYVINVYKGLIGERMLRRLRYQLFQRILRFPLARFRKIQSGEIVPIIASEVEPLGGFIGDSYSLPLYQGGLLLTSLGFIFAQDVMMGAAVIALYPVQMAIIPRLQTQVNQLNRQRVLETRKLANRITDTIDLAREIRQNRTTPYELAGFSGALGRIFDIRYRIFRKKFFVKFLNNFLLQVTPFLFFLLGGYLVIEKQLSLGELVAVLAAYKEMTPPWRELLGYYQDQQDAGVRYEQIVAQFDVPNLEGESDPASLWKDLPPLPPGDLVVDSVSSFADGVAHLKDVSFMVRADGHVAIFGGVGSGKAALAELLTGLAAPSSGTITIGGRPIREIPAGAFAGYVGSVDGEPNFVSGTLRENMIYGLKRFPQTAGPHTVDPETDSQRSAESLLAGNSVDDPAADWVDYPSAGTENIAEMDAVSLRALEAAGLGDDLVGFGLGAKIDPDKEPELAAVGLVMRCWLAECAAEGPLLRSVESFNEGTFNDSLTIGQNLLFGVPKGAGSDLRHLMGGRPVRRLLKRFDLDGALLHLGYAVAGQVLAQIAEGRLDADISENLPVRNEEILRLKLVAGLGEAKGPEKLSRKDRWLLESVALHVIPSRHTMLAVADGLRSKILSARHELAKAPPASLAGSVSFFDRQRFIPELTLRENIIFGEIAARDPAAGDAVADAIKSAIDACGARDMLVRAALNFDVGAGGRGLDVSVRQQLAIARALVKRPHLLIVNGVVEKIILENLISAQQGKQLICFFAD